MRNEPLNRPMAKQPWAMAREDGASCGGGFASGFGGIVDEIAGDCDCDWVRTERRSTVAKNLKIGDPELKVGRVAGGKLRALTLCSRIAELCECSMEQPSNG